VTAEAGGIAFRGVTMSLHKLTAWSGYDYLSSSRSVVGGQACAYGDAGRQDRRQHPHVMVETRDGKRKRSYTICAIPYQDPQQEAERLKAVHEARVKIVPRV
jgi:hypothetical protein